MLNSIDSLAEAMGRDVRDLLADTAYIIHGTTASLNALVTGDVAKVGFLTTKGHRDSIYIMNLEGRYAGLSPEEIQDITADAQAAASRAQAPREGDHRARRLQGGRDRRPR